MSRLDYRRPTSLSEAIGILQEGKARVLAGGTDLTMGLRNGTIGCEVIVDIKDLPGLREIQWQPDGGLRIGAAVTVRQIYQEKRIVKSFRALAQGAEALGSLQIRGRATIGGNLANASPCMDTAPPLVALGGTLEIAGPQGTREIPAEKLFAGVKKNTLQPGEILVAIKLPAAALALRSAFDKIKRVRGHDLALVNAAVSYNPAQKSLRAVIGSCGITPVLTPDLRHENPEEAVEELAEQLAAETLERLSPIDDVRASSRYRRAMAALLCRRLVRQILREKEVAA